MNPLRVVPLALVSLALLPHAGLACAAEADTTALRFRAVVGSQPARCGVSYPLIGRTRATIRLVDLRLYVSEVRWVTAGGDEVPFRLR